MRSDSNYDEYTNKFTIANGAAAAPQPATKPAAAAKDIVATAIGAGQFKTLVAAVQAAGLVSALQGKGPFTVFAPTDAAFAKLPAGTVEGLLKDPKALANILLYHVLAGEVKAAAVKDGLSVKTLQGSPVTFKIMDGKPMINGANIVATDIMASNGVIHVIDSVILPPAGAGCSGCAAGIPTASGPEGRRDGERRRSRSWAMRGTRTSASGNWTCCPAAMRMRRSSWPSGKEHGDLTYTLNTVGLPNGEHALRLRVVRNDGNYDEYVTKFVIANK